MDRRVLDALDAGVRILVADTDIVSSTGSAPVICRSTSAASGVSWRGAPLFGRDDRGLETRLLPSSLKLLRAALAVLVCFAVGFAATFGSGLRAAGFATRVAVAALGATLARGGRGIVAVMEAARERVWMACAVERVWFRRDCWGECGER